MAHVSYNGCIQAGCSKEAGRGVSSLLGLGEFMAGIVKKTAEAQEVPRD